MADELRNPTDQVYHCHEPKLIQSERVRNILVKHPCHVGKNHGRPPPRGDAKRHFTIDKEVDHTEYELWKHSAADPVAKDGH